MALNCALCDHSSCEHELVTHIRETHAGLRSYVNLFPDLPVVSRELFGAVENSVKYGFSDDTPGLHEISPADRELILVTALNNQPLRSRIDVMGDF